MTACSHYLGSLLAGPSLSLLIFRTGSENSVSSFSELFLLTSGRLIGPLAQTPDVTIVATAVYPKFPVGGRI